MRLSYCLIAAGCLSLMGIVPAFADQTDDEVEAVVKKLGGSVVRNQGLPGKPIINAILSMSDCKDEDIKKLAGLKSLWSVQLYRTNITDAGLKELAALKTLTSIDLMKTKITDEGIKALGGLPLLDTLALA